MKIIEIDLNYIADEDSVIALGNFDGVHKGHMELINKAVARADDLNIKSSILLFNEHTDNLIKVGKKDIITTNQTKFEILENLGVDIIYLINFTREFMAYTPKMFLKDFLADNLKIRGVVVGYDYTYGFKKSGDVDFLLENKDLFDTIDVINQISSHGEKISSTLIRNLIEEGRIKEANDLLSRPYKLIGEIIHAKGLGKKMGYPTANLKLVDNFVIPRYGVYDTDIIINGERFKASTNIGTNPTVEHDGIKIEAHILDFDRDIYGEIVELELLDFVRPELKFDSIEELFDQIAKDVLVTRNR
ncbi:Riboflavin biosynthesis protein ribF [Peptoniphilus harei]|uniref:Riboflavin biosynthesis protein n=1 Tax=Peptoniphilus harei TaxID=54005 RepID=A0A2X1XZS1_9FIRM|nr:MULTISPECIES: bifunctional riboflavin kinase/FAD synthetase [Peptoniphilus]MBS6534383.1 bifunctional riboflavin kinase/FAD synthetase [Peptoniphilus harei]MDU3086467.1 bifunctional riboflavin kinase/FAD synthetase [Peptoniphilus harei]MDU5470495.1 bifunctional riboflavin kinase/FAD synthetase [Peptoniphilus harei]MDU6097642.1 bifunctional riboflavin kinase/FAD synthetase [Peptoniphilus harei]OFO60128.1 riboflavin biosynthesis protein RibF [Peptoniphilus sp. HMSC075B08]